MPEIYLRSVPSDSNSADIRLYDPASFGGVVTLVIQNATHAHTADNLALVQHHVLVIQDAIHSHAVDNLALTQHQLLSIDSALHGHNADNLTLTAYGGTVELVIQNGVHTHVADNVVLVPHDAETPIPQGGSSVFYRRLQPVVIAKDYRDEEDWFILS